MTKRENITIKTKYKTKQDCIENCRDIKRKTRLAVTYSRQISGEVYPDGSFELSSRAKGSAMYEFRGIIKEEVDGVYMVGDIIKKSFALKVIYISIALATIFAIVLIMSMNPVFILFAVLFAVVPWLNLVIINYSDYLYKDIVRKVS